MAEDSETAEGGNDCALCGEELVLDEHRTLRLRHGAPVDVDRLQELYARLTRTDLHRRFFTGGMPARTFFERWSAIADEGGFLLVVELTENGTTRLVAEAGYALLADGDGELGIVVDPDFRGWLGPWLLDALFVHADDRGIGNMQALVLTDNRGMMALANKRGFAVLDHPEWAVVRLSMSTSGRTPSWPGDHDRPRILVESSRTRWAPEQQLREAGFDVAICGGSCQEKHRCPVLDGEPCPLVDGADAVVIDLPPDDPRTAELTTAERVLHPGVRLLSSYRPDGGLPRRRTGADILEALGDLEPAERPDVEPRSQDQQGRRDPD